MAAPGLVQKKNFFMFPPSHCRGSREGTMDIEKVPFAPAERIWGWVWGSWTTTRMYANDIDGSAERAREAGC